MVMRRLLFPFMIVLILIDVLAASAQDPTPPPPEIPVDTPAAPPMETPSPPSPDLPTAVPSDTPLPTDPPSFTPSLISTPFPDTAAPLPPIIPILPWTAVLHDTFAAPDLAARNFTGLGWGYEPQPDGSTHLRVFNSSAPVFFAGNMTLGDAAVEALVEASMGSTVLYVRFTTAGGYEAELIPLGELQLRREGVLIAQTDLPNFNPLFPHRHPGETALDDPTTGQAHKALPGVGQFDHFQPNAVLESRFCGLFSRVTLIHKRDFNRVSSRPLHLMRQVIHLRAILRVCRCHVQRQSKMAALGCSFRPCASRRIMRKSLT
jgi:hypothetical protein